MICYIKGDITTSNCDIICHQVNCKGKMNSGVAKAIREKWPQVYQEYWVKCEAAYQSNLYSYQMLGDIQICTLYDDYFKTDKHQHVVNLFAQDAYGYDNKRYTSYDAFWQCLNNLKQCIPKDATIAFPYKIGCVRGGANWNIIRTMIEEVFKDRDIYFYYLNDEDLDRKAKDYISVQQYLKEFREEYLNEQENN